MIIKPPKPGLGFGIRDLGFWDLVWLGLGVAISPFPKSNQKCLIHQENIIIKITFIKANPLIWAIQGQNNESFIKLTPLIWVIENQNNKSFIKVKTSELVNKI